MDNKGFIFGKFYPFHMGHAALIEFGLSQVRELYVIVCASDKERLFSLEQRCEWINCHFQQQGRIRIIPFAYREDELVNSSVPDREVSRQWAEIFSRLLPEAEVVFTSEGYGAYLAEHMDIRHQAFDPPRDQVPVSASMLRHKPLTHWQYLPGCVQPDMVKVIVLNGSESTGKTSLCQRLAQHYQTCWVPEAGREVVPHTERCQPENLHKIISLHAKRIQEAKAEANKLLFVDTDHHITRSYSRFLFDQTLNVPPEIARQNKAALMLYCTADAPYVQDGTRLTRVRRNQLDISHRQELARTGQAFELLEGNFENRFKQACLLVDQLLSKY